MNTLKISINKITESLVIFKKIGKCNCMRFFFCRVYIPLWNNSLISISILRNYWLETMRDGHKHFVIYLDTCMGVCLNPLMRA